MKLGLFIFLWSICLVGNLANGKKFVQESETVQFEDCEPSDTEESEVAPSSFSILLANISIASFQCTDKASYGYALLTVNNIAPDSFFSPPDSPGSIFA